MTNDTSELKKKVAELEKRIEKLEKETHPDVGNPDKDDILLAEAIEMTKPYNMVSASLLQRRLSIGYARAARILDQLEKLNLVGPAEGSEPRKVIK